MTENVLITTSTSLEGYKVTKQLGLVRGIYRSLEKYIR